MKKMEEMKNKKSKINGETDSSSFRYLLSSKISTDWLGKCTLWIRVFIIEENDSILFE